MPLHFYGNHAANCNPGAISKSIKLLNTGYTINIDAILHYKDLPYVPPPLPPSPLLKGTDDPRPSPPPFSSENYRIIARSLKTITDTKSLARHLLCLPLNSPLGLDGDEVVGDYVLRSDNYLQCRSNGIDGDTRLVITQRINPKTLPPSIKRQGWFVLRDAFAKSDEDAIYFLVQLQEQSQHKHFGDLLAGPEGIRSKFKYINICTQWKRVPNCPYHVYYATINSRSYDFTNRKW